MDRGIQPAPSHTTVIVGTIHEGVSFKAVACRTLDEFHSSFSITDPTSPLLLTTRLALANGASEVHAIRVVNREDQAAPPRPCDYRDALDTVSIEVPRVDLLLLPNDPFVPAATRHEAWRMASHFCRDRRALLILDSPPEWFNEVDPFDEWSDLGLVRIRQGLALESVAMFHPRVVVEMEDARVPAGASGAGGVSAGAGLAGAASTGCVGAGASAAAASATGGACAGGVSAGAASAVAVLAGGLSADWAAGCWAGGGSAAGASSAARSLRLDSVDGQPHTTSARPIRTEIRNVNRVPDRITVLTPMEGLMGWRRD